MSKAKSKPRKPSKATAPKAPKAAKPKLKMREIQPAYTKGMKVRVTPEIARAAILKVMAMEKSGPDV